MVVPKTLVYTIAPILYKTSCTGNLQENHRALVEALWTQNAVAMELEPRPVEQLEPRR